MYRRWDSLFSVMIVSYNGGDRLIATIDSLLAQSCHDWSLIIKDGGSDDGSLERAARLLGTDIYDSAEQYMAAHSGTESADSADGEAAEHTPCLAAILRCPDDGIYDAMNQALGALRSLRGADSSDGRACDHGPDSGSASQRTAGFVYFLGCGDTLADGGVLAQVREAILGHRRLAALAASKAHSDMNRQTAPRMNSDMNGQTTPVIYYGDIRERRNGQRVPSNPRLDDYACYRNVPSHQACLYDERLLYDNLFDTRWRVRADYEQFLRLRYREHADTVYMNILLADYEGGGYSESAESLRVSEEERRQIIAMYLPARQIRRYDMLRALTLAPLRTWLSHDPRTAAAYNHIKDGIYSLRRRLRRSVSASTAC